MTRYYQLPVTLLLILMASIETTLAQPFEVSKPGNTIAADASVYYEPIRFDEQAIYMLQRKPIEGVVKFDRNLNLLKSYTLKKPSGSQVRFEALGDDFYLFEFTRSALESRLTCVQIDLESGQPKGSPKEVLKYPHERMIDPDSYFIVTDELKNQFILVGAVKDKARYTYEISVIDKELNPVQNTTIKSSFKTNEFQFQQLVRGNAGEIVFLGSNTPSFSRYDTIKLAVYDRTGKELNSTSPETQGFELNKPRLLVKKSGEVLLACLYGDKSNEGLLSTVIVSTIDLQTGSIKEASRITVDPVTLTSKQGKPDNEKPKSENRAEKGKQKPQKFSYNIHSIEENPADNSIVFTAEVAKGETKINMDGPVNNNLDILVFKMKADRSMSLITGVRKDQREEIGAFTKTWPDKFNRKTIYSSHSTFLRGNTLYILFNDHNENTGNASANQPVKFVREYDKESSTYLVTVDLASGKQARYPVYQNDETGISLASRAMMYKNEIVIPRWRYPQLKNSQRTFLTIRLK